MTARTETVVLSSLLSDLPAAPAPIREQVAGPLLRALDLVPTVPAWITDPGLIADILAGFCDLPDDLTGGA
ncbi:hypothetical protein ACH4D4_04700 [Streptomyces pristinaespiralis]|uniref:hypothetical protein n=1 Tax=Streptomyces pristinaespiralis TaxID=38300 RepID=UPI0037B18DFA